MRLKFFLLIFFATIGLQAEEKSYQNCGEIFIEGEIRGSTYAYVKKSLEFFEQEGVDHILVHIDTPGGEAFSAIRIAKALVNAKVPVTAFIDDWAVSAGALIAYACPEIYVAKTAIMGDAAPVRQGADGDVVEAKEKIISAFRTEFASIARAHSRNELLAMAMVDKDIILVEREGALTEILSIEDKKDDDVMVCKAGKLLTLTSEDLVKWNIATSIVEKKSDIPNISEKSIAFSHWKVKFFEIATHPLVTALLSLGLLLGIYIEMSTTGFGVAGAFALLCLLCNVFLQYSMDTFNFLELIILGLGLIALMLELFVIPGFGIVGICGIILTFLGAMLMVSPEITLPNFPRAIAFDYFMHKCEWFFVVSGCVFFISILFYKKIIQFFYAKSPLVLRSSDEETLPVEKELLGQEGLAFSIFKPSGKMQISDKIYDALSRGCFIEKGSRVRVIQIEGNKIFVEEII